MKIWTIFRKYLLDSFFVYILFEKKGETGKIIIATDIVDQLQRPSFNFLIII